MELARALLELSRIYCLSKSNDRNQTDEATFLAGNLREQIPA